MTTSLDLFHTFAIRGSGLIQRFSLSLEPTDSVIGSEGHSLVIFVTRTNVCSITSQPRGKLFGSSTLSIALFKFTVAVNYF